MIVFFFCLLLLLLLLLSLLLSLLLLLIIYLFLELKTTEGLFFQRVCLYIWDIAGYELGTLSIRVDNSATVHDNSWALKLDNFSKFQNVINNSLPTPTPSVIMTLCVRKSICDSLLIIFILNDPCFHKTSTFQNFLKNWICSGRLFIVIFLDNMYFVCSVFLDQPICVT